MSTGIEWTDETWNPIRGCSRVSPGCEHCYAEKVAKRFSGPGRPYEGLIAKGGQWNGQILLAEHKLADPLRWQSPRMIFVNSMSDLFHEKVPDEWIDQIFAVMALAQQHVFQCLTKRPERMLDYCSNIQKYGRWLKIEEFAKELRYDPRGADGYGFDLLANHQMLPNVWLGVSVEDQQRADERIPLLLQTPAAIRWLSCEPLLGPIVVPEIQCYCKKSEKKSLPKLHTHVPGIDWVVCGGESGPGARPMHPDWARSLRDQCAEAGVPYFFKQWGEWVACEEVPRSGTFQVVGLENPVAMEKAGKKKAGALLDGREHKEVPEQMVVNPVHLSEVSPKKGRIL